MLSIRQAQVQILPVFFPIVSSSAPMPHEASETSSSKLMLVKHSGLSESLYPVVPGSNIAYIFFSFHLVIQASVASRC